MRVLHCIHSLAGGGAERQLQLLADCSSKHGMEAAIVCVNDVEHSIADPRVKIYRTNRQNRFNLSLFPAIEQAIVDFVPHLLHAWLPAPVTVSALIAARRHRTPCVFSFRNRMAMQDARMTVEYLVALALASGVVANNPIEQSTAAYRLLYRIKRGASIPNAVDVAGRSKPAQWRATDPLRMLFAGRLTRQKNVECLLLAAAQLKATRPFVLTLCGEGEQRSYLESRVRQLGIEQETRFLGFRYDILRIMCDHDLLILPSRWEGMPNVLLEAFGVGLPCVISDIPPHRRLTAASECALLFDPASPEQLLDRIVEFCQSPHRGLELAAADRRVAERYTTSAMTESYRDYYSSVLRTSSALKLQRG